MLLKSLSTRCFLMIISSKHFFISNFFFLKYSSFCSLSEKVYFYISYTIIHNYRRFFQILLFSKFLSITFLYVNIFYSKLLFIFHIFSFSTFFRINVLNILTTQFSIISLRQSFFFIKIDRKKFFNFNALFVSQSSTFFFCVSFFFTNRFNFHFENCII